VTGDSPSKPRLIFDDPFRVIGYGGDPANEMGILLWSGIDPHRYFSKNDLAAVESFSHLLTLDYAGQIVAWQSLQSDNRERRWSEAPQDSIETLNRRIREVEPLRYRQA
jgi:hypothetical protein